jgi:hypothetical protein
VNCHLLYSTSSCQPTKTSRLTSAGTSTMVTILFKALSRINNVMYIRAINSDQIAGPGHRSQIRWGFALVMLARFDLAGFFVDILMQLHERETKVLKLVQ